MEILKKKSHRLSDFLIMYVLLWPAVIMYVTPLINRVLTVFGGYVTQPTLRLTINILVVIICLFKKRYIRKQVFAFFSLATVFIFIEYLLYNQLQFTTDRLIQLLFEVLVYFGFAWEIDDEFDETLLWKAAVLVLAINMIYTFGQVRSGYIYNYENMDFAYNILPSILIILYNTIKRRKILDWILGIVGFIFVLMQGTRGPILCIVLFVVLVELKEIGLKKAMIPLVAVGASLVVFFESTLGGQLLLSLVEFINNRGFNARVIEKLISSTITDDHGRNFIKDTVIEGIRQKPISGWGLYGDRFLTKGIYDSQNSYSLGENGTYAHNFILEFLCDYGVVIGTILIVLVSVLIIKAYIRVNEKKTMLLINAICIGFIHLFVSGSYLQHGKFFFLIGLCMSICVQYKEKRLNEDIVGL